MTDASAGSGQVLRAVGLKKTFRKRVVVNRVDLSVAPGEIVGLLGPNGAGKSTTFNMVVGLLRSEGGRIEMDGTDVTDWPMHLRARAGLGYLPQDASVFRKLTVEENFLLAIELQKDILPADRRTVAARWIQEFGLEQVRGALGETLSGGERRRTEIARCLIAKPKYLLFDEPFAGVDPLNVAELQKEIRRLKERGLGILITDHNVRETLAICDRATILHDGVILESGAPKQLLASQRAKDAYLGEGLKLE